MPQFDSQFFASQIFWVCVCFGVLWGAMHWWVVPRVRDIQKIRSSKVGTVMEEVRQLHAKSTEIRSQCDAQQEILEKTFQHQIQSLAQAQEKAMAEHLLQLKSRFDLEMSRIKDELNTLEQTFTDHLKTDALEIAQVLIQRQKESSHGDR
ncbi:ATP synthase subunit B family protein [Holospora undulata]|uniref:ATP synthase subunit b n=1 Tax=Holospora undulata HU1 TaxID=1321371 RepID=A0A061JG03_9PROT|nr:H+transporting two-sector ATPase subunit B/B' [Holospora undulata]ETZ04741.1 ATP synthase subunit b [Holospora undulata HU1]